MLAAAQSLATTAAEPARETACQLAANTLAAELARLEDLATRNSQVSQAELSARRSHRDDTLAALTHPRLRLDALRLIWRT